MCYILYNLHAYTQIILEARSKLLYRFAPKILRYVCVFVVYIFMQTDL